MPAKPVPSFESFEEMQKYLDKNVKPEKRKVDRKKRKQYTDPTPKINLENIYRTIHYYVREGDTFTSVLKDCRLEIRGPSTILMAHDHKFEESCSESCRVVE